MFSVILFVGSEKKEILEVILTDILNSDYIDGEIRVVLKKQREKIKSVIEQDYNSNLKVIINSGDRLEPIKKAIVDLSENNENLIMASTEQVVNNNKLFNQLIEEYIAKEVKLLISRYKDQEGYPLVIDKDLIASLEGLKSLNELPIFFKNQAPKICYYFINEKYNFLGQVSLGRLNYKFWLEDGDKVFGDGPCDILLLVDEYGSLRKAALDIDMSYSQAWNLINDLEEKLGFKLIEKKVGGASGGGSELTSKGRILMNNFNSFRQEVKREITRLEKKYFKQNLWAKLK
ncbi:winged helix-turn-helix domain-containing protein [Halanaerobaculum tunisiense]